MEYTLDFSQHEESLKNWVVQNKKNLIEFVEFAFRNFVLNGQDGEKVAFLNTIIPNLESLVNQKLVDERLDHYRILNDQLNQQLRDIKEDYEEQSRREFDQRLSSVLDKHKTEILYLTEKYDQVKEHVSADLKIQYNITVDELKNCIRQHENEKEYSARTHSFNLAQTEENVRQQYESQIQFLQSNVDRLTHEQQMLEKSNELRLTQQDSALRKELEQELEQSRVLIYEKEVAKNFVEGQLRTLKAENEKQIAEMKLALLDEHKINMDKIREDHRTQIGQYMERYMTGSSASKGRLAEDSYETLLNELFPETEIKRVSNEARCCDLEMIFEDSSILFEIKNYKQNVPSTQVQKFHRDLKLKKCHGIMVSCESGIALKGPFQIDFLGDYIALYLPKHQFDASTIILAVNVIKNIGKKIEAMKNPDKNDDTTFTKETMESVKSQIDLIQESFQDAREALDLAKSKLDNKQFTKLCNLLGLTNLVAPSGKRRKSSSG